MTRRRWKKPLFLACTLFVLISLPLFFVEGMRSFCIRTFAPIWRVTTPTANPEHERLMMENCFLRQEINRLSLLVEEEVTPLSIEPYKAAHVLYREPGSWNNSFYIDIGSDEAPWMGKNSPVLYGEALVGVVEKVGKKQSRVRLITDSALTPAVRVVRGEAQDGRLASHICALTRSLRKRKDLPISYEERRALYTSLKKLQKDLSEKSSTWYLAKGILQGTGAPLWRSNGTLLRGIGFNYDFSDEEGPARELRTGAPIDSSSTLKAMALIKEGDLLVTSGMDGVFPEGFHVGEVTKVFPLEEGAVCYSIEALPAAGNLNDLPLVFVLPPLPNEERS